MEQSFTPERLSNNENAVEKIVTHDGKFHTDEVFAHAILKDLFPESMELAAGGKVDFIKYIRTKNPKELARHDPSTMLVDIGTDYDPEHFNFDHHQLEGAGTRENGVEYAAAGLVWKQFGTEWITYVDTYARHLQLSAEEKQSIWELIDTGYVQLIDSRDTGQLEEVSYNLSNGMELSGEQFTLAEVVRLYNVDTHDGKTQQDRFNGAVEMFRTLTLQIIHKYMDLMEGLRAFDPSKAKLSPDGKTVIFDQNLPPAVNSYLMDHWEEFKNVEFFASLNAKHGYSIMTVPEAEGLRTYRNPRAIPEALRLGNDSKKINEVLGIKNGVLFSHKAGFFASCRDRASAEAFLRYCTTQA